MVYKFTLESKQERNYPARWLVVLESSSHKGLSFSLWNWSSVTLCLFCAPQRSQYVPNVYNISL